MNSIVIHYSTYRFRQQQRIPNGFLLTPIRVPYVGHEAFVSVHAVLDGLQAAVGEEDEVLSFGVVAVAGFLVAEVVAALVILHPVLIFVHCGSLEEVRFEIMSAFGGQACARKGLLKIELLSPHEASWTHLRVRRVEGVSRSPHRHGRHREQQEDSLASE